MTRAASSGSRGLATPGYEGVGGLYAQLLGDRRFVPYAVLSGEQYRPTASTTRCRRRIAAFVEQQIMRGEVAGAMFDLVVQGWICRRICVPTCTGAGMPVEAYVAGLGDVATRRPGEFSRRAGAAAPPSARPEAGPVGERLLSRLDLRNIHFADLVTTSSTTPSSPATSVTRRWPNWSR